MARTTAKGLYVWDLEGDTFNHTQLAANWDTIDSLLGVAATQVQTLATLPTSGNFAGRLVMLSGADGGFPAWTLVRYDGSTWRNAGAIEILPAVPSSGNYAGRIVMLSAASGGFSAWSAIRYDGAAWDNLAGGMSTVNTGAAANNIKGLQTPGDLYISDSARGFVLVDRASGIRRRLFLNGGNLSMEVVT